MTTDSNATPLPSFRKPPVIEVALSVQFAPLEEWGIPYFGLFWQKIRAEFPDYSVQPPLASEIEPFDRPIVRREVQLMFTQQPDARCWYLTKDGHQLIQVQKDRFVCNWRKLDLDVNYPRYKNHGRPQLEHNWNRFTSFIESEKLPKCEVVQCELTYVNHIPKGQGWNSVDEWSNVFTFFEWKPTVLPAPESGRLSFACTLPDKKGRIRIDASHAMRPSDGQEVLALNLTCRSKPISSQVNDILECMDLCREWIVRGFADITTTAMHKLWERER